MTLEESHDKSSTMQDWASGDCRHKRRQRTVTDDAIRDVCDDCGSERTTYAVNGTIGIADLLKLARSG